MNHPNLVIGVVGDNSCHENWLSDPQAREFDLCLIYYGDQTDRYAEVADYYFARKGIKLSLIHEIAHEGFDKVLSEYKMIWLPDDDIGADTHQINSLFQLAEEHRLQIAQPAIGRGDASYQALRCHPGYLLRYTGFVEMMCPLFTSETFERVLPMWAENVSGWGFDWIWSSMFSEKQVAVIDAVAIHHMRSLGSGGAYDHFAQLGVDPSKEFEEACRNHNVSRRQFKHALWDKGRYRAIKTDGSRDWTRSILPWRNPRRAA